MILLPLPLLFRLARSNVVLEDLYQITAHDLHLRPHPQLPGSITCQPSRRIDQFVALQLRGGFF
jgi:hypothetical protein